MTGAEIAAVAGAVVWVIERLGSWWFKTEPIRKARKAKKTEKVETPQ